MNEQVKVDAAARAGLQPYLSPRMPQLELQREGVLEVPLGVEHRAAQGQLSERAREIKIDVVSHRRPRSYPASRAIMSRTVDK
jgi:hypothetical protein